MCQSTVFHIDTREVESRHSRHFVHHHFPHQRAWCLFATANYFTENQTGTNRDDFRAVLIGVLHLFLEIPSGSLCYSFGFYVGAIVSSDQIWPGSLIIRVKRVFRVLVGNGRNTWCYDDSFDFVFLGSFDAEFNAIYSWSYHIIVVASILQADGRRCMNDKVTTFDCLI